MNLHDLYQWAVAVRNDGGLKASWPDRHAVLTKRTETATMAATQRRASQSEGYPPIRKAIDVLIVVEACDRTGRLAPYLATPEETRDDERQKIPTRTMYCFDCRIRRYRTSLRTNKCPICKQRMENEREIMDKDMDTAKGKLNRGGIRVA